MAIYKEDYVDIELTTGNIHRSFCNRAIGEGDNLADRFGIRAFRNGNQENLGGTCVGLFIRADGDTVAVEGTVTGNEAYVDLPQACYAVEGQFALAIKVVNGSATGTLRIVDGVVSNTTTGEIVDPGTIIPSIETLIAEIEAATASIPADYSSLWASLAPVFDPSDSYEIGQYVTHEGGLYRFKNTHSGTWSSSDVDAVDLGTNIADNASAVSDLKSRLISELITGNALDSIQFCNREDKTTSTITWTWNEDKTSVAVVGSTSSSPVFINLFSSANGFPAGMKAGGKYRLLFEGENVYLDIWKKGASSAFVYTNESTTFTIPNDAQGVTIRLYVPANKTVNETVSPKIFPEESLSNKELTEEIDNMKPLTSTEVNNLTSLLDVLPGRYFTALGSKLIELDSYFDGKLITNVSYLVLVYLYSSDHRYIEVLSVAGKLHFCGYTNNLNPDTFTWSDITITDKARTETSMVFPVFTGADFVWNYGKFLFSSGEVGGNYPSAATTNPIPIAPGTIIYDNMPLYDIQDNVPHYCHIASYADGVYMTGSRSQMADHLDEPYIVPAGATHIRICYGHLGEYGITNSREITGQYFTVMISQHAEPQCSLIDQTTPLYVSFGASTETGAIHHFTGQGLTWSKYSYPHYIGNALGLKTVNLAVGSSGLLHRAAIKPYNIFGTLERNYNMMDIVFRASGYNPDNPSDDSYTAANDVLSKASLITLTVGIGNDASLFTNESKIGSYDDFYPYDATGGTYRPTGTENESAMVSLGATWFGCFNWVIHWLSTHYPKAQIVVIFGSIGDAYRHKVTIADNSQNPGVGQAPKKLVFASVTDGSSVLNGYINTRLKTLADREHLDFKFINLYENGTAWNYYASQARNSDQTFVLYSTIGTEGVPSTYELNLHPSDEGYLMFARYITGRVSEFFFR